MIRFRKATLKVFMAAILVMAAMKAFSQSHHQDSTGQQHPNEIYFLMMAEEFFDGQRPFIQTLTLPTMGGGYRRKITPLWSVGGSVRYCYRDYMTIINSLAIGDVTARNALYLQANIDRQVLHWRQGGIKLGAGITMRIGEELVYVAKLPTELFFDKYYLREPGPTAGFRIFQDLPLRLTASLKTQATFFPWRYRRDWPYAFDFPNRSTKSMLSIEFNLGFRF